LSSGLPEAERADEPACLGAVDHDDRSLAVPERAEPNERGLSGDAYVRAVLMTCGRAFRFASPVRQS
jgi:hypothetical protein